MHLLQPPCAYMYKCGETDEEVGRNYKETLPLSRKLISDTAFTPKTVGSTQLLIDDNDQNITLKRY